MTDTPTRAELLALQAYLRGVKNRKPRPGRGNDDPIFDEDRYRIADYALSAAADAVAAADAREFSNFVASTESAAGLTARERAMIIHIGELRHQAEVGPWRLCHSSIIGGARKLGEGSQLIAEAATDTRNFRFIVALENYLPRLLKALLRLSAERPQ